jgi:hypothetical protein
MSFSLVVAASTPPFCFLHAYRHNCAGALEPAAEKLLHLKIMQLRIARLCLDCDEVHGERECPVCASERFAFLTRWVPAEERRRQPRASPAPPADSPVDSTGLRWAKRGAAGVALFAVSRWLWHQAKTNSPSGTNHGTAAGSRSVTASDK